jgi:hypothetical protein
MVAFPEGGGAGARQASFQGGRVLWPWVPQTPQEGQELCLPISVGQPAHLTDDAPRQLFHTDHHHAREGHAVSLEEPQILGTQPSQSYQTPAGIDQPRPIEYAPNQPLRSRQVRHYGRRSTDPGPTTSKRTPSIVDLTLTQPLHV